MPRLELLDRTRSEVQKVNVKKDLKYEYQKQSKWEKASRGKRIIHIPSNWTSNQKKKKA